MKNSITPEEKLLRLIRGQKKPEQVAQQAVQTKIQQTRIPASDYLTFQNIRKGIFIVFIISCIYLTAALVYPLFIPENPPLPKLAEDDAALEKVTLANNTIPYASYSEAIKNRQLFTSSGLRNEEGVAVVLGNELIKDINLVGILSGDNTQAVIEDKKAQKTYYVAKNQLIGQFRVEDIQDGKIVLGLNGQKYELYL